MQRWIRVTGAVLGLLVTTGETVAAPKSHTGHSTPGKTFPSINSFSPQSAGVGQAGFTLTISGGNFTAGTVCFFNSIPCQTIVVSASQLLVTIAGSDLAQAGNFPVVVSNGNNKTASALFLVSAAATELSLASSVNPSTPGQPVDITATVATVPPAAGTPTGTVIFLDGLNVLGTNVLSGGQATFSTATLSAGTHWIFAIYEGDGNCGPCTNSEALAQVVGDPSGAIASVATLSSSVNPAVFGQMVVFTANVQSTVPGAGPPSGAVTFQDQGVPLGFGFLNAGQATLALSSLSVGPHSITAVYNGDSNFTPSTSPPLAQIITVASTTTAVSSSADPSVSGQSIIFNASVSAAGPGGGTPTGQVTFQDGSTVLGTVVLSSGHATFTTSSLAVGTHSISAVYSGDVDYAASASALFSQTVNKASSTTALVSSPNPSVFGQSVTLTATVSAVAPGSGVPTGTVSFKDGSFPLLTVVLQSGQATLTSASLSRGSHSLMAVYNGDGQFYGSSSAAVGQSVNNVGSAPSQ